LKVPMCHITIYGNKKDRKAVLEYLQRQQILDISQPNPNEVEQGFSQISTGEAQSEFLRQRNQGERALAILQKYAPESTGLFSSLKGRKPLSTQLYYQFVDDIPEMQHIAQELISRSDEITEKQNAIVHCKSVLEELQPWLTLDVPMEWDSTTGNGRVKSCVGIAGVFTEQLSETEILSRYDAAANTQDGETPAISIEVIDAQPQQTCVWLVCRNEDVAHCETLLRSIGFSRPKIAFSHIPKEMQQIQEKQIAQLEQEIQELEKEIILYRGTRNAMKFLIDYFDMRTDKYQVLSELHQRNHIFALSGYVPEESVPDLTAQLEHVYHTAIEIEPESAMEEPPILLRNPVLAQPVEGIVRTFAMPRKSEIDPTTIMSIFYYIFFGLMFSDAGYGLVMVLSCGIALRKFRNMEESMRKSLKMFLLCGISTMFWGIMFGSYFGDAVSVISSTFFNHEISIPPVWFEPVNNPMKMLMFSFLFGIIHLFTGLGISLYQYLKRKDYASAFSDCICWFMLVGGGIVYLFHVDMFLEMASISAKLPTWAANIAAVIAGIGALGIVLTTSRFGGIGKRLAKGLYSLYNITGWLSDILSYSRLLALGLATGVIATVFNKMGSMFGDGVVGAILFILVFLIGHALNIGVNLLGAYVHTNRLQFVEFFSKFYEGGGREFKPFAANTRYYKFQHEPSEVRTNEN